MGLGSRDGLRRGAIAALKLIAPLALALGPTALCAQEDPAGRPAGAFRAYVSGQDLWGWCGAGFTEEISDLCYTYVVAALDTYAFKNANSERDYCLPSGVKPETLVRAVRDYMKTRDDITEQPASAMVFMALTTKYPCPK